MCGITYFSFLEILFVYPNKLNLPMKSFQELNDVTWKGGFCHSKMV